MWQVQVVTQSTITPWLLGDAKDHLRVTHNDDDGYIQLLTLAVRNAAEQITRRALFTQTIRIYADSFECDCIELPRPMLQSVTSVKYYDTAGVLQTMDTDDYQVDVNSTPGRICPVLGTVWPSTQDKKLSAVIIEYVAGWAHRGDLPFDLRQAMLIHMEHLYDMREAVVVGPNVNEVPWGIQMLYEPHRVITFS